MKRLLWITDAHLDHLSDPLLKAWFEKLANARADMLLLGGDTANSRVLARFLGQINDAFPGNVALVAGNHDYYHTSITSLRSELVSFHRNGVVVFEPGFQVKPVELADGVYLCGSGGWGDASAGCGDAAAMLLNDECFITELKTRDLNARLRELGDESARHLQQQLECIPTGASCVIVLTHVPPWPEACWHEGRQSDAYALPRFCWQAGGQIVSKVASEMPQTRFIVLCGHTHSDGLWNKGNITCYTAGSAYGRIDHSGMIVVGETVSLQTLNRIIVNK